MTEIMLEATDIRKVLGDAAGRLEVLKGINLSLGGGELTLLMGPSGSGKTTLLSVLGCMRFQPAAPFKFVAARRLGWGRRNWLNCVARM